MNPLLQFLLKHNYHISKQDAGLFNIAGFEHQIKEIEKQGIPIKIEYRLDLGETFPRYYLDPKYREANK